MAGDRGVVAVVELGQAVQVRLHVGHREGGDQGFDFVLVGWGRDWRS